MEDSHIHSSPECDMKQSRGNENPVVQSNLFRESRKQKVVDSGQGVARTLLPLARHLLPVFLLLTLLQVGNLPTVP